MVTLNQMVQYKDADFDLTFAALSDATRRGVLVELARADASVTVLARAFDMTLTGMKKHIAVLEEAGLVETQKVGRVRTCRLGRPRLDREMAFMEGLRQLWAARFDALEDIVRELKERE